MRHRSSLPNASGIYFVSDERNNLLYIGQATDLQKRWAGRGHHRYKQFARKGLDKITLSYILAPVTELDTLERQYITALKPSENDGKVKDYLPKKSPRLSELQRLLKLVNTSIFSPYSFRGFVTGMYTTNKMPRIVLICKQNMGELLENSSTHRTKRHFYTEGLRYLKLVGVLYEDVEARAVWKRVWKFDARQVVFEFVELFDEALANEVFEKALPFLEECQILGVKLKKLNDSALLQSILQSLPMEAQTALDYLHLVNERLQTLPPDFALDEKALW